MEIRSSQYKIRGMNKDLSYSAFDPKFSWHNKNVRLTARDNNDLLSVTNEKGNLSLSLNEIFPEINISVVTNDSESVTQTKSIISASVVVDYESIIKDVGMYFSLSQDPSPSDIVYSKGFGSTFFHFDLNSLTPNTDYYFKSFAQTTVGAYYGDVKQFTTSGILSPSVGVTELISRTNSSLQLSSNILEPGGDDGVAYSVGFVISNTNDTPEIGSIGCVSIDCTESVVGNQFTGVISDLISDTQYHCRSYITNSTGTSYGEINGFATLDDLPVVNNDGYQDYYNEYTLYGSYSSWVGGVSSRGFLYSSVNTTPLITDVSGTNSSYELTSESIAQFSRTIVLENLVTTTYFFRPFIIQSGVYYYGDVLDFTYTVQ